MKKYFRLWQNKYITANTKNIDDFIEMFESLTQVLKKWKEEGVYLDPDSNIEDDQAIFITTDLQFANEGGFKQDISDELEKNLSQNINDKIVRVKNYQGNKGQGDISQHLHEQQLKHKAWMKLTEDERWAAIQKTLNYEQKMKEIDDILKINIFSRDDKIKQQFLNAIKAIDVFKEPKKQRMGVEFATLIYEKVKKFKIQFWSITNEKSFDFLIPTYMKGSHGIIYFYDIDEKISENLLKLVTEQAMNVIPILLVGYDSVLSKNLEKIDQNIQLIQKYLGEYNSLYISVDKPDSMFKILDKIISIG
ncbi:MAG: hypothetical protein ACTSXH_09825 [Promethearchaeota archaeon]